MNKKSIVLIRLGIGLALLTLGCQALSNLEPILFPEPTPTPRTWPYSAFVPPHKSVEVKVNQPLEIKSHHISTEQLGSVEIRVNGQLLRTEETAGQATTFPGRLIDVEVTYDQSGQIIGVEPDIVAAGQPTDLIEIGQVNLPGQDIPAKSRTVALIWVGRVPGIYELSMVARDVAERRGNTIVQRIEVK